MRVEICSVDFKDSVVSLSNLDYKEKETFVKGPLVYPYQVLISRCLRLDVFLFMEGREPWEPHVFLTLKLKNG